jgi:hypothetical protein
LVRGRGEEREEVSQLATLFIVLDFSKHYGFIRRNMTSKTEVAEYPLASTGPQEHWESARFFALLIIGALLCS